MVGTEWINFQNLHLQILQKCNSLLCLFLDVIVKYFSNYLSLHYKNLFLVDDI